MFTGLSVVSENGETLDIDMPGGSDGYLIASISGLGPVSVTNISTAYGQLDGESHQSSRRDKRTIIIDIVLEKGYYGSSIEERRYYLDRWFVPKQELLFYIEESRFGTVSVSGRTEDIDSDIFTSDPHYTVTIVCENPNFASVLTTEHAISLEQTIVGENTGEIEIDYPGTIETGFLLEMTSWAGTSGNTIIRNRNGTGLSQNILIPGDITDGNRLRISTVDRNKFVQMISNTGGVSSALGAISNDSVWIKIKPGLNYLRVSTEDPAGKEALISYNVLYGGL